MAENYDVVIAGGGHNGLIAGGYLAKAGLNVCVVEHQPYLGGGVVTLECSVPGFKHDICSTWHGFIQANPLLVRDELELKSKFGLKYLFPELSLTAIFPDNRSLNFYRDVDKTCESIAQFSQKDAVAYRKFYDWSVNMLDMFTTGMYSPPSPYGAFAALMDSNPDGQELLRATMMSGMDVIDMYFEDPHVKIALGKFVSEGMIGPNTKGTGLILFLFIPLSHKYGGGIPVGGSAELSNSLGRCIEHHGGTIKLSSTIKKFKISGDRVSGVVLESGEEIEASRAVISNFNIKQIPSMIEDAKDVPERFLNGVKAVNNAEFVAMNNHLALNEAPHWTCGDEANEAMWVEMLPDDVDEFLRCFEGLTHGEPDEKLPVAITNTIFDPTRAPDGKHTLYLYCFQPYELKKGGAAAWDEIGNDVYMGLLNNMRKYTDNMGDENILGVKTYTPLDYERHNPAWARGDFGHIGTFMWQQNASRPMFGWGQYRMPVKDLYLCGPSTHPGLGVVGGGRAAVQVVFEDLGLDFEKIAG